MNLLMLYVFFDARFWFTPWAFPKTDQVPKEGDSHEA